MVLCINQLSPPLFLCSRLSPSLIFSHSFVTLLRPPFLPPPTLHFLSYFPFVLPLSPSAPHSSPHPPSISSLISPLSSPSPPSTTLLFPFPSSSTTPACSLSSIVSFTLSRYFTPPLTHCPSAPLHLLSGPFMGGSSTPVRSWAAAVPPSPDTITISLHLPFSTAPHVWLSTGHEQAMWCNQPVAQFVLCYWHRPFSTAPHVWLSAGHEQAVWCSQPVAQVGEYRITGITAGHRTGAPAVPSFSAHAAYPLASPCSLWLPLLPLASPCLFPSQSLPVSLASQQVTGQVPQPSPLALLMLGGGGVRKATLRVNINTNTKVMLM
ncbi:unnamed protein product [Closterium sp. NIES-64]|nr:unnamed protein product [Closterium sp. NIES-64]